MSIKARISDAEVLWAAGRREGAWVMALIAAAGTSRKRYPEPMGSGEAFKAFIRDVLLPLIGARRLKDAPTGVKVVFGTVEDGTPLEDIIYEQLRCSLVHEGRVDERVSLSESSVVGGRLRARLTVGSPHEIPDFWVLHLIAVLKEVPENVDEFAQG